MSTIRDRFAERIPALRKERAEILDKLGKNVISEVTVAQAVGGMRGVNALVCDTSVVDPEKGLLIRGTPVAKLSGRLAEEVFYLLLTGELPEAAALADFQKELNDRAGVPASVWKTIEALPDDTHPMTMLSAALLALDGRSVFRRRFDEGMKRDEWWEPALEDVLNVLAVLPEIAAGVYRMRYKKGKRIPSDPSLDWAADLAHMLGNDDPKFYEYMRLATIVQSDHEGGHASALTAHTVGSVLSNIYLVLPAGYNALAGPLHGLASQVCLKWIQEAIDQYKGVPTREQMAKYTRATIASGRVVPGYGHAVLRAQDPRYLAILAFGEKNTPRNPLFKTVVTASRTVPDILMEGGKVKNPWPNVDAINGALFHHYGVTEIDFYTVFFAVALSLGISAQYVINRALGTPITRPRSVTSDWIRKNA
jgi:citrate synthase